MSWRVCNPRADALAPNPLQEGWTDILYAVQQAVSPWVWLYFVPLVAFGAFFLVNLALAVLYLQFAKDTQQAPAGAAAPPAADSAKGAAAAGCGSANADMGHSLTGPSPRLAWIDEPPQLQPGAVPLPSTAGGGGGSSCGGGGWPGKGSSVLEQRQQCAGWACASDDGAPVVVAHIIERSPGAPRAPGGRVWRTMPFIHPAQPHGGWHALRRRTPTHAHTTHPATHTSQP